MYRDPFPEYSRESEPSKYYKSQAWQTAMGLQEVDGLQPSDYLRQTAQRNIEGELPFAELEELLQAYYAEKPSPEPSERTEEADLVSARIASLLSEKAFHFSVLEYLSIHKRLFTGIYAHAGALRDFNISKKEWVLDGDTVTYGATSQLLATLEYDLAEERKFSYKGLSMEQVLQHLAVFVARLWQIHPFAEGNTRTTAVFFIKYLQTLGFGAINDAFAQHAWTFRNALVRANYTNLQKGVYATTTYLELFLRNLLLGEKHALENRHLHILYKEERENPI